jgi:8-oxo-dGTP diphosphatase
MEKAVMFVIIENNKILLEKRPDNKKEDPGFIAIPGGHVNRGEETYLKKI